MVLIHYDNSKPVNLSSPTVETAESCCNSPQRAGAEFTLLENGPVLRAFNVCRSRGRDNAAFHHVDAQGVT